MREIRTSGLMSGDGKRSAATAPVLASTSEEVHRGSEGAVANCVETRLATLRRDDDIGLRGQVNALRVSFSGSVCQPSTLRMVICPEASKAQNNIAAVSPDGEGDRVYMTTFCTLPATTSRCCFPKDSGHPGPIDDNSQSIPNEVGRAVGRQ